MFETAELWSSRNDDDDDDDAFICVLKTCAHLFDVCVLSCCNGQRTVRIHSKCPCEAEVKYLFFLLNHKPETQTDTHLVKMLCSVRGCMESKMLVVLLL